MKRLLSHCGVFLIALLVLGGCASGPKYAEVKSAIPPLKPDEGRIYVYRSGTMFGAAIQPSVMLGTEKIGESVPGGFFFVDRAPGNYELLLSTEVDRKVSFTLEKQQTRYVKMTVGLGVIVYRVYPELVDTAEGDAALPELSYIGTAIKLPAK